jgi:putative DNA primase/helicase
LFRKRLVVAIETKSGRRLDETITKELTGGDRIRARRMRENPWEFAPSHKIILATNHKPLVHTGGSGTWRRLMLLSFSATVTAAEADREMPEKLRAEYPGILAWCVSGCRAWQRQGLAPPKGVLEKTQEYKETQDRLGRFLSDWVDQNMNQSEDEDVQARTLYAWYVQWCKEGNEECMSETMFGETMHELGYEKYKDKCMYYRGLSIRLIKTKP